MKTKLVKSTYSADDCIFLLKDLTGIMNDVSLEEKERQIQSGINYSEMICKEESVGTEINTIFQQMLSEKSEELAKYISNICAQVYTQKGKDIVIVSLARAGSPVGVLMRRYFQYKYQLDIPHYSISIIRDKGIDENALHYIRKNHPQKQMIFVDGWTGKGSITSELRKSINQYNKKYGTNIDDGLVVLADPAKKSAISGTKKDVCIPNACLNSTVSGLVSRTIHNAEFVHTDEFHGAKYFAHLENEDFSNLFIHEVEKGFSKESEEYTEACDEEYVNRVISQLKKDFPRLHSQKIKLSIGETSRAVIRRKPKIILVKNLDNPDLKFILHMAKEKNIEVKEYDTQEYACIGILE